MDFLITTSASGAALTGNRLTARQWGVFLEELGHEVEIVDAYGGESADVLVALHAGRSKVVIARFRKLCPEAPVVLALTGTDVYPEPGKDALLAMEHADRIVGLQELVRERVPLDFHPKLSIIVQSGVAPAPPPEKSEEFFDICVVGHMRAVKDPLRAAAAARELPDSSRIRIRHAGAILEPEFFKRVQVEQAENSRYAWLGELAPEEAIRLIAKCRLQVVSSYHEGGGRVIGESIVAATPVLAARSDAAVALLGGDYTALYDAGDTAQLTALMHRAETDADFYDGLVESTRALAARFDPALEKEALRRLVADLWSVESGT